MAPALEGKRWYAEVEGPVDCPPVGIVDFGPRPKEVAGTESHRFWRMPLLAESVQFIHTTNSLATDVDEEVVVVRSRASGVELVRGRFVDASYRVHRPEDKFLTVAPSGRMLAGVRRATSDKVTAVVLREGGEELPLAGFNGGLDASASFSPEESLVALTEGTGAIGLWRTDSGELVARFVVPVALAGAVIDGASGIPPWLLRFVSPAPDGWTIDRA